jgi:histidine triad (HIT) family protein
MISDVFCKIVAGEISRDGIVYEDEEFIAKEDIAPQAPVHIVIFPKKHVFGMHDATPEILGKAMMVADKVAQQLGIHEKGYRLVLNEGEHGGKLVPHLHIHLLGGKSLGAKIVKE